MSTINIQPVVTANGETILSVFTPMGRYVCVLGADLIMKMIESNPQGSKALGLGSLRLNANSNYDTLQNLNKTNNLHIYFYNSGGKEAVLFNGKLPNFVTGYLDVDSSKITAKASNSIDTSTITDTKEGLIKERLGLFNLCGTMCGITAYWPQGYGTGEFDSICVSLVDLEQLKTLLPTSSSVRSPIYAGITLAIEDNASANGADFTYIRNGVTGITDENTFLLKIRGRAGLWDYNLVTGDLVQSKSTYSGYMGMWGYPQFVIDGVLYGLTTRETASEIYTNNSTVYLFSHNLTDHTEVIGSSCNINEASSLIKIGQDLYLNTQNHSYGSTSSSYKPAYKKVTLSNMTVSSTTLTHTAPTYLGSDYSIDSFDDGTYLLHDIKNMVSFKFTDITNIEGSIVEPYWVCLGQPVTVGEKTYFMAYNKEGFYYDNVPHATNQTTFKTVDYGYNKYMLLTGDIGPLLAYGQFSKTYEKAADMDFTTNYYINVTSSN